MDDWLKTWKLDERQVRDQMYRAPTARERERWHAIWLVSQGWSAAKVARALGRDPHTIGAWLDTFRTHGPAGIAFEQSGGAPPALNPEQQAALAAALRQPPRAAGIALARWTWKGVAQYLRTQFG